MILLVVLYHVCDSDDSFRNLFVLVNEKINFFHQWAELFGYQLCLTFFQIHLA